MSDDVTKVEPLIPPNPLMPVPTEEERNAPLPPDAHEPVSNEEKNAPLPDDFIPEAGDTIPPAEGHEEEQDLRYLAAMPDDDFKTMLRLTLIEARNRGFVQGNTVLDSEALAELQNDMQPPPPAKKPRELDPLYPGYYKPE